MARTSDKKRINTGRYTFGALLHITRFPLLIATICVVFFAVYMKDPDKLAIAGAFVGATILLNLVFIWKSAQVCCRLCRAQFLRNLKCSKKSHAHKVFGSYTLPVALAILARKERIRCPYCGEKHPYFYKDKKK